jgi:hypothetical protein
MTPVGRQYVARVDALGYSNHRGVHETEWQVGIPLHHGDRSVEIRGLQRLRLQLTFGN